MCKFQGQSYNYGFLNCVAIALIVYEVGYLGLLLLNNLEVIPSVFKLFTRSKIFVSYFIYNLNHFQIIKKNKDALRVVSLVERARRDFYNSKTKQTKLTSFFGSGTS